MSVKVIFERKGKNTSLLKKPNNFNFSNEKSFCFQLSIKRVSHICNFFSCSVIIYIEDKNGAYFSEDVKKRWTKLTGKDSYEFFQTERGKKACFYEYVNSQEDLATAITTRRIKITDNQEKLNHSDNSVKQRKRSVTASFQRTDSSRLGQKSLIMHLLK